MSGTVPAYRQIFNRRCGHRRICQLGRSSIRLNRSSRHARITKVRPSMQPRTLLETYT